MDFDINRDLAEDAAEDYAAIANTDPLGAAEFANGWVMFCNGEREPDKVHVHLWKGYIAARDAPDD